MFYDEIFIIIAPIIATLIILIISRIITYKKKSNDQKKLNDDLYKQLTFKRQVEKAEQVYDELKATMGEEIDEIFNGYSFNDMVEALNCVGNIASAASCSISEMVDAFNAIGTPSEETIETQEQKEPQVIFEPKVMIIESQDKKPIAYDNIISIKQDDKEVNPFDDWYNNFMKEIEQ